MILSGYEINLFSYHNNLVCFSSLSQSKRVIHWRLIIEEFGTNIEHMAGFDIIVAGMLSRLPCAPK